MVLFVFAEKRTNKYSSSAVCPSLVRGRPCILSFLFSTSSKCNYITFMSFATQFFYTFLDLTFFQRHYTFIQLILLPCNFRLSLSHTRLIELSFPKTFSRSPTIFLLGFISYFISVNFSVDHYNKFISATPKVCSSTP